MFFFFFFLKNCSTVCRFFWPHVFLECVGKHVTSEHLCLLCWPSGKSCGDTQRQCWEPKNSEKKKDPLSTLSSRRMPEASFQQVIVMRTSLSISPCRSCRCTVPHVGNVALKPCTISPLLAPIQVLQPPVGWLNGRLFIPNIPKM